jgi:hypothetical protein
VGQAYGCPKYNRYPTIDDKKEMDMFQALAIHNDRKEGEIEEFLWGSDRQWPTTPDEEKDGIKWVVAPANDTEKKPSRNLFQWVSNLP